MLKLKFYLYPRVLLAMLVLGCGIAFSQGGRPDYRTILEVQEAAAATQGVAIPCHEGVAAIPDYAVCVVTALRVPLQDLLQLAVRGLDHWRILATWSRLDENAFETSRINYDREEMLIVVVVPEISMIIYMVNLLGD